MTSESILRNLTDRERNPLEVEIYDVLKEEGISIPDYWFVTSPRDFNKFNNDMQKYQSNGFVAKAMSARILHKSDFKAVKLRVPFEQLELTFKQFMLDFAEFDIKGVLFVPMAGEGVEFLIGSTTDDTFGVITIFGVGGTLVEVIKDVTFGKSPVTRIEALDMIDQISHQELLDGPRGMPKTDKIELAELIQKVSEISYKYKDIVAEIDLNPVRVTHDGIIPLDARIIFHPDQC